MLIIINIISLLKYGKCSNLGVHDFRERRKYLLVLSRWG